MCLRVKINLQLVCPLPLSFELQPCCRDLVVLVFNNLPIIFELLLLGLTLDSQIFKLVLEISLGALNSLDFEI